LPQAAITPSIITRRELSGLALISPISPISPKKLRAVALLFMHAVLDVRQERLEVNLVFPADKYGQNLAILNPELDCAGRHADAFCG
jgi:hypothetical protein